MKAVVQRVRGKTAITSQTDAGHRETHDFTGPGFVVLLGWEKGDETRTDLDTAEQWIVSRVQGLRVFPDPQGRMNLSLADYAKQAGERGGILWVSQFTLAASLESGFRPSFTGAMSPDPARDRFDKLVAKLRTESRDYAQIFGIFGADMDLSFTNWGPVTIPLQI